MPINSLVSVVIGRNVPYLTKEGCQGPVKFIDFRDKPSEKVIYLCMEYISDSNLFQFIREDCNLYSVNEFFLMAVTMFHKLANDMCVIHEKGVAHRDLTMENVMVDTKNLETSHFQCVTIQKCFDAIRCPWELGK